MTIDNFIPTLWAVELLENLNDAHVYVDLLNRDYEGQISAVGDSVRINSIGRVAVGTYTKNSTIAAPETLDDSQMILIVTESKYFNFEIDDVDKKQQQPKLMSAAMKEAAWALSDVADTFVADLLEAGVAVAGPDNTLTAVSVGTGATDADAYETLVDLGVLLDNSNTPSDSRWVVIPPWYHGLLLKDPRFVSFGTPANVGRLMNGTVGEAAGFKIVKSNNVPDDGSGGYTILSGHSIAATFAEQINDPEAFRPQDSFSDALKGLHLYGAKVTRPYALASVVATEA